MKPGDRRTGILALAAGGHALSVDALAQQFRVSRETVRRDLARLGEAGLLRRVHGGAAPAKTAAELPFQERRLQNAEAKRRIGHCAAGLFTAGDTLMIDTGSTTEAFAAALAGTAVTVITNSLRIASHFPQSAVVLGGSFHPESGQLLGPITVAASRQFSADHAVLGVGAINVEHGASDYDLEEAALASSMIGQAARLTLLADHTKFGRRALVRICRLGPTLRIVTNEDPEPQLAAAITATGVTLIVA